MAKVQWDSLGERFYEVGVDRGVLYPNDSAGVAWNGLISVNQTPSGGEAKPLYLDGLKYENRSAAEDFSGSIEAFTYPDEFSTIMGDETSGSGLHFGQQPHREFGLSYRTMIGDDTGVRRHYKIHLLYNALATFTTESYSTLGNPADPSNLSWTITTRGVIVAGRKPTAELIVDTRDAAPERINTLERILYGESGVNPRMPELWEVVDIFDDWPRIQINRRKLTGLNPLSYKGLHDLKGNNRRGLYLADKNTRLKPTTVPGLYRI